MDWHCYLLIFENGLIVIVIIISHPALEGKELFMMGFSQWDLKIPCCPILVWKADEQHNHWENVEGFKWIRRYQIYIIICRNFCWTSQKRTKKVSSEKHQNLYFASKKCMARKTLLMMVSLANEALHQFFINHITNSENNSKYNSVRKYTSSQER